MNIFVVASIVAAAEEKININSSKQIEVEKYVLNPLDGFAIEEAIKTKEKFNGTVTLVTATHIDNAEIFLRSSLAMGVDFAIIVKSKTANLPFNTAKNIVNAIETKPDIIFIAEQTSDYMSTALPVFIAELFDIPCVSGIKSIEIENNTAKCERDIDTGSEIIRVSLPCVISVQKGLNSPRFPKLPDIIKAKSKPINCLEAQLDDNNIDDVSYQKIYITINSKIQLTDSDEDIKQLISVISDHAN